MTTALVFLTFINGFVFSFFIGILCFLKFACDIIDSIFSNKSLFLTMGSRGISRV